MIKNNYNLQLILAFILGNLVLFSIYTVILLVASKSTEHLIQQFSTFWYWLVPMGIGFGIQTSMFWYIKKGLHLHSAKANVASGTSLTSSTASMVACCAHHLVELLPFLGLSALSLWLSKYQQLLFAVGFFFNLLGIIIMYRVIINHKTYI